MQSACAKPPCVAARLGPWVFPETERASRRWPKRSPRSTPPASCSTSRRTTARWFPCAKCTGRFFDRLRKAHPETPILAITPIFSTREAAGASQNEGMREHIRQVVSQPHRRRRPEPASGRRDRPAGTFAQRWAGGWHASQRSGISVDGRGPGAASAKSAGHFLKSVRVVRKIL